MNLNRHLYGIGAIMAVLTAASYGSARMKAAGPSNAVLVTNTTSQPVPTVAQGTTQVGGTVGLSSGAKVGINGNVTLDPNTSVHLPYDSTNPLAIKEISNRIPVEKQAVVTIPDATNGQAGVDIYTVPIGKVLVIQSVFGSTTSPFGEPVHLTQITSFDGTTEHDFPVHLENDNSSGSGFESSSGMTATTLYVEQGAFMTLYAQRTGLVGTSTATIGFSGYLMDTP
jgi:hypothetical protein